MPICSLALRYVAAVGYTVAVYLGSKYLCKIINVEYK